MRGTIGPGLDRRAYVIALLKQIGETESEVTRLRIERTARKAEIRQLRRELGLPDDEDDG